MIDEIKPKYDVDGEPRCSEFGCPQYHDVGDYDASCHRCELNAIEFGVGNSWDADCPCIPALRRDRDRYKARCEELKCCGNCANKLPMALDWCSECFLPPQKQVCDHWLFEKGQE